MRSPRTPSVTVRRAIVLALLLTTIVPTMAVARAPVDGVSVIVRKHVGAGRGPEAAVAQLGGRVERRIRLIHGFVATVPLRTVDRLGRQPGVASITRNERVTLSSVDGFAQAADLGSLRSVHSAVGAKAYWAAGFTGHGVDVAMIDSGVAPVEGLTTAGKIVNGPDLSFESQDPDLRYLDTFGHGTHMAGIIGGRDHGVASPSTDKGVHFLGIAPGARIVSVKVADAFGTTDIVQVLAAIDWVVKHRQDGDLDIRVLNLSFGTDSNQAYTLDPLAYAVENAWRKGIFVVVAAGNRGYGSPRMNSPAYDPFIMAVGASDRVATLRRSDDVVASFSSRGSDGRHPDLVAPGKSIVSLRDPGSFIDRSNPAARVGTTPRFFRGSGTSQAAAVVSGAAALVIQQRPTIKPDELKALLMSTAFHLPRTDANGQGAGMLDLTAAFGTATPQATQSWIKGRGTGTLEDARGTLHLTQDGIMLMGERDIFGGALSLVDWLLRTVLGATWVGGSWLGRSWTGDCWCTETWAGPAWTGRSWTDDSWAGRSWTSDAWTGRSWTGWSWTGGAWTGRSWTSDTWAGDTWSSAGWGP